MGGRYDLGGYTISFVTQEADDVIRMMDETAMDDLTFVEAKAYSEQDNRAEQNENRRDYRA